jgi:hypothetical protein
MNVSSYNIMYHELEQGDVLIEFKKWMCYIDGQKNKYSVLNECNRILKYNITEKEAENKTAWMMKGTLKKQ